MTEEREGTAADFARLLANGQPEATEAIELDDLRAEAARRHRLPPAIAERLVGDTAAEVEADAARLAPLVQPEPPEHVALARRAIAAAEDAGRARLQEAGLHNPAKAERNRALVALLHPTPREEPDQ